MPKTKVERVRLDALLVTFMDREGRRPDYAEIAAFVFKGQKTRPLHGVTRDFNAAERGAELLSQWNNGNALTALKPRHILRLSQFFKVKDITELLAG